MNPQTTAKQKPQAPLPLQSTEEAIRDYAFHPCEQGRHTYGLDADFWQEAKECLPANIPTESTRTQMHNHIQITQRDPQALKKHGAF